MPNIPCEYYHNTKEQTNNDFIPFIRNILVGNSEFSSSEDSQHLRLPSELISAAEPAELPGMKEEDINVSVIGDTLTITGERKAETEVEEENYYCCERSYGSFLRSIAIPSHVKADKIEANYEDGLLEISLPKAPEVKPKKVSVSAPKRKATTGVKRARGKKKEKVVSSPTQPV